MRNRAYLFSLLQGGARPGRGGASGEVIPGVLRGFIQDPANELPRIHIPRTSVNKGKMIPGY